MFLLPNQKKTMRINYLCFWAKNKKEQVDWA